MKKHYDMRRAIDKIDIGVWLHAINFAVRFSNGGDCIAVVIIVVVVVV